MNENYLYLERKNEIGTIYINRPEKKNAFTLEMWKRLIELLEEVDQDPEIKVLVIRGVDDTAFAAGNDISEFTKYKTVEERSENYNKYTAKAYDFLHNFRKPTIAMIQRYCIGGGCGIAIACDFRITDSSGIFAITPSKIGLVYSFNTTKQLIDLVGPANGKYLLMTGQRINAHQSFEMGLVTEVCKQEEIEERTYDLANILCSRAQLSVRSMKLMIHRITEGQTEDNEETRSLVMDSYSSNEYKEGVNAFLEKRKPNFSHS